MKTGTKRLLMCFVYVAGAFLVVIIVIPKVASGLRAWFCYPDNWYLSITIIELLLLSVMLFFLARAGNWAKRDILSLGPIREIDQEMMFQEQHNELRFSKNLQWNIAYYLALVFGAVFAFGSSRRLSPSVKILLFGIALLAFDYGIYFLTQIQFNLRDYRMDITRTAYFRRRYPSYEGYQKQLQEERRVFRDMRYYLPIILAALLGLVIDAFTLWDNLWILFKNTVDKLMR